MLLKVSSIKYNKYSFRILELFRMNRRKNRASLIGVMVELQRFHTD
jgi:hypothetical protein